MKRFTLIFLVIHILVTLSQSAKTASAQVPIMKLDNQTVDFGVVPAFRSQMKTFRITNIGTGILHVNMIYTSDPVFFITITSYAIPPGSQITDTIVFMPSKTGAVAGWVVGSADGVVPKDSFIVQGSVDRFIGMVVSSDEIPSFSLEQNNPNPFSSTTKIHYKLNRRERIALSVVSLTDVQSKKLLDEEEDSGEHMFILDAADLPSGTYIIRMEANGIIQSRIISVVK